MTGKHPRGEAMRLVLLVMIRRGQPMRLSEIAEAVDIDPRLAAGPVKALERNGLVERVGVAPREGRSGRVAYLRSVTPAGLAASRLQRMPERPAQMAIAHALAQRPGQTVRELSGHADPDERILVSSRVQQMKRRGIVELANTSGRAETWTWRLAKCAT